MNDFIISTRYKPIGKIGEGSGGTIYKFRDLNLDMDVVFKEIKHSNVAKDYLYKEANILKNVSSPYLPKVFNSVQIEDMFFTVMEFIPGYSFSNLLDMKTEFSQKEILKWSLQLCEAIEILHNQQPPVLHCDIKPANIMLRENGNICLIDFNISMSLSDKKYIGYSDGYSSPELIESITTSNIRIVDERTDIYSLGATLYHIITGEKLKNDFNMELVRKCSSVEFAIILQKACENNPKDRYQSIKEMHNAFQHIHENNSAYISLLYKQKRLKIFYLTGFVVSIILCLASIGVIRQDKLNQYFKLVDKQIEYRIEGKFDEEINIFKEASEMIPSNLQSYYQNAYSLYEQGNYEYCILFIKNQILGNEKIKDGQENEENVYYLMADSYYQLKEYENSINIYTELMKMKNLDALFYRDYAITLAYNGQIKVANEKLDEAIARGLTEDSIYYAKSEMENALGNLDLAIENMNKALALSNDINLKQHAYIALSNYYRSKSDLENVKMILEKAHNNLPIEKQIQILESLAQVNIDLANRTSNNTFRYAAIDYLNIVIEQGWDSYQTYDNLVLLYEKSENYTQSLNVLKKMKSIYGEDYNYFKRLAFIEVELQNLNDLEDRNYEVFKEYYRKANSLYKGQDDQEMSVLKTVYDRVIQGGW